MRTINLLSAVIILALILIDWSQSPRDPLPATFSKDPFESSTTTKSTTAEPVTKIYDIRPLLEQSDSDGPDFDLQRPSTPAIRQTPWREWLESIRDRFSSEGKPSREELVEGMSKTIQESVDPDSWRDAGGSVGALRELQGQLIVRQTPAAHDQIEKVLQKMRRPDIRFFSRRTAPLFAAGILLLSALNLATFRRRRRARNQHLVASGLKME